MNEESWDKTKRMFPVGSAVDVLVTTEMPFGLLVEICGGGDGILECIQMERAGYRTPDEYPRVGSRIRCHVVGVREWSRQFNW